LESFGQTGNKGSLHPLQVEKGAYYIRNNEAQITNFPLKSLWLMGKPNSTFVISMIGIRARVPVALGLRKKDGQGKDRRIMSGDI
jgi:hypothetical protein